MLCVVIEDDLSLISDALESKIVFWVSDLKIIRLCLEKVGGEGRKCA
jgi:hypothetical protein